MSDLRTPSRFDRREPEQERLITISKIATTLSVVVAWV
jgi:hypothetical protein